MELRQCFSDDALRAMMAAHRTAVDCRSERTCREHLLVARGLVLEGVRTVLEADESQDD